MDRETRDSYLSWVRIPDPRESLGVVVRFPMQRSCQSICWQWLDGSGPQRVKECTHGPCRYEYTATFPAECNGENLQLREILFPDGAGTT